MRALILAAGIGSRLGAITQNIPKCLVPLGDGTCMLDRVVDHLYRSGVTEQIINLFHHGDKIRDHVEKSAYRANISFSPEDSLLGTGGGIKHARWFLENKEPFFVYNSDIYFEGDILTLKKGMNEGVIASLGIMTRDTSRSLLFDEAGCLAGWENRKDDGSVKREIVRTTTGVVPKGFSGIHLISPEIFSYLNGFSGAFSIIDVYLEIIKVGKAVQAIDFDGAYWLDMGTPERLDKLSRYLTDKKL